MSEDNPTAGFSKGNATYWREQARENIQEWGVQDTETVLLAIMEELGEVTQAYLEQNAEGGDPERVQAEIDDLAPLLWQLQWAWEDEHNTDDAVKPISDGS